MANACLKCLNRMCHWITVAIAAVLVCAGFVCLVYGGYLLQNNSVEKALYGGVSTESTNGLVAQGSAANLTGTGLTRWATEVFPRCFNAGSEDIPVACADVFESFSCDQLYSYVWGNDSNADGKGDPFLGAAYIATPGDSYRARNHVLSMCIAHKISYGTLAVGASVFSFLAVVSALIATCKSSRGCSLVTAILVSLGLAISFMAISQLYEQLAKSDIGQFYWCKGSPDAEYSAVLPDAGCTPNPFKFNFGGVATGCQVADISSADAYQQVGPTCITDQDGNHVDASKERAWVYSIIAVAGGCANVFGMVLLMATTGWSFARSRKAEEEDREDMHYGTVNHTGSGAGIALLGPSHV